MTANIKNILIEKINKSKWWHVLPSDKNSYKKRGKFLASTFQQAEFYGTPNNFPEKVKIFNPIYGFSEIEILRNLFPDNYKNLFSMVNNSQKDFYNKRIKLDALIFEKAKKNGYDSIILLSSGAKKFLERNIKPRSIELNLLKN